MNVPLQGSQVNTHAGRSGSTQPSVTEKPPCVAATVCAALEVASLSGEFSLYYLHSVKSTLGRQYFDFFFDIPDLSHKGSGGGGGEGDKKNEAKQHFLFKRKQEKAEGARFGTPVPLEQKNLTLTGNGSASKKSLTAPAEGQ